MTAMSELHVVPELVGAFLIPVSGGFCVTHFTAAWDTPECVAWPESELGTDPHTWCLVPVPLMVFVGPRGWRMLAALVAFLHLLRSHRNRLLP